MSTLNIVKNIISEKFNIRKSKLNSDTDFMCDLEFDSLDRQELICEVERRFCIAIPYQDACQMHSIGDVVSYVNVHKMPNRSVFRVVYDCFRERARLRNECANAQKEVGQKYDSLSRCFSQKNYSDDESVACVRVICRVNDLEDGNWFVFDSNTKLCPKFKPYDEYGKCNNRDCLYYARNHEYFKAKQRYHDALDRYVFFWRDKFGMNVK